MSETGSEEYRARRARHKFLQSGGPTVHTMTFDLLPPGVQSFLAKKCRGPVRDQPIDDLPVAACYMDQNNWCLVTTRRVHWCTEGRYTNLSYGAIKQVGWSAGPGASKKRTYVDQIDLWIDTEDGKVRTKEVSPWFFIFEKSGLRHELKLEVGPAQTAIWDAIDMLIRLELIHPRDDQQPQINDQSHDKV